MKEGGSYSKAISFGYTTKETSRNAIIHFKPLNSIGMHGRHEILHVHVHDVYVKAIIILVDCNLGRWKKACHPYSVPYILVL